MDKKCSWITRLFLVLFTMSVSVAVLPCGVINARGLFGEITSTVIVQDKEQEIVDSSSVYQEKVHKIKGVNVFNIWFEILIVVALIAFGAYVIKLPRGDTIVTQKVRMNN